MFTVTRLIDSANYLCNKLPGDFLSQNRYCTLINTNNSAGFLFYSRLFVSIGGSKL